MPCYGRDWSNVSQVHMTQISSDVPSQSMQLAQQLSIELSNHNAQNVATPLWDR